MKDYRSLSLLCAIQYFFINGKTRQTINGAIHPTKYVNNIGCACYGSLFTSLARRSPRPSTPPSQYCVSVCWYAFININFFFFFKPNNSGCACYGYFCTSLARRYHPNNPPLPSSSDHWYTKPTEEETLLFPLLFDSSTGHDHAAI